MILQVFHLEDVVEQTGYILEKDSEYSQRILEEEEEVSISVTQKGGKTLQHQVISASLYHSIMWNNVFCTYPFHHVWDSTVCFCVFQEVIVKDSSSGWDLSPELNHFSSRTRQVLQYMNPNKINMDLLVDLIDYLSTNIKSCLFRHHKMHLWTCGT